MSGIHYYVIDVETTGLKSGFHEITELSIIRCSDRNQLTRNIICDYPQRASFDALKITGKTIDDLSKGFLKENVVKEANNFFNLDGQFPLARCIIGHNVNFDKKFLHALWESCNQEFPANLWVDTMAMALDYINKNSHKNLNITKTATGKVSKTLHACCDLFDIKKIASAHNSKSDSRNTYFLWQKLIESGIDYLPFIKTEAHFISKNG